jgi:hypothetical protein
VYYFWGEIFKIARYSAITRLSTKSKPRPELGSLDASGYVNGSFMYHGDEKTTPPPSIANKYARYFPYRIGMPGPSYSWSIFGSNVDDSIRYLQHAKVSPLILERFDESLVVLRHYMRWSLADVVVTKPRKALSQHPGADAWPQVAINELNKTLHRNFEYKFYNAANSLLNQNIIDLTSAGIDVAAEISLLQSLRARVTEVNNICVLLYYKNNRDIGIDFI